MSHDEQELRRAVAQADRARAVIEDPVLQAAFTALEARYIQGWRAAYDAAARDDLWHRIKALEKLQDELAGVLNDGLMARAKLEELRTGNDTP